MVEWGVLFYLCLFLKLLQILTMQQVEACPLIAPSLVLAIWENIKYVPKKPMNNKNNANSSSLSCSILMSFPHSANEVVDIPPAVVNWLFNVIQPVCTISEETSKNSVTNIMSVSSLLDIPWWKDDISWFSSCIEPIQEIQTENKSIYKRKRHIWVASVYLWLLRLYSSSSLIIMDTEKLSYRTSSCFYRFRITWKFQTSCWTVR